MGRYSSRKRFPAMLFMTAYGKEVQASETDQAGKKGAGKVRT